MLVTAEDARRGATHGGPRATRAEENVAVRTESVNLFGEEEAALAAALEANETELIFTTLHRLERPDRRPAVAVKQPGACNYAATDAKCRIELRECLEADPSAEAMPQICECYRRFAACYQAGSCSELPREDIEFCTNSLLCASSKCKNGSAAAVRALAGGVVLVASIYAATLAVL